MLPGTVATTDGATPDGATPDGAERIGVFGGTFDPIHVAHVVSAVEARRALSLHRVVLVPAGDPWQKRGSVTASATDRLAMVEAAVEGISGLEVSSVELERDGPSYTYQTLEAMADPGRELFLIVGADVAAMMHSWVGVEHLPDLATLVVVDRAGEQQPDYSLPPGWPCERVAIPRLDVSSTHLRARAARGWPLDGLVPPGVVRVIAERGLYRS